MNHRPPLPHGAVGLPVLLLAVASLACALTSTPSTPTPEPTPTPPPPTVTPTPQPLVKPTPAPPEAEPTEAAPQGPELSGDLYVHPSGSFALYAPTGWSLNEGEASAVWRSPDDSGEIDVYINATGYTLDQDAFLSFVTANEQNYFMTFSMYEVTDRRVDDFGALVVTQSLVRDGTLFQVRSIYYQDSDIIYEVDFWSQEDRVEAYRPAYDRIWEDMKVDSEAGSAKITPYWFVYEFADDQGLFSFEVPYGWLYERFVETYAVVDKFSSPDTMAFVESIKYDDGSVVSKAQAGSVALELLRQFYADDIKITDDQVQPDGSERLTWFSKSGGYSGITFFETRGTTFLMLTFVSDDSLYDIYASVFGNLVATYYVP